MIANPIQNAAFGNMITSNAIRIWQSYVHMLGRVMRSEKNKSDKKLDISDKQLVISDKKFNVSNKKIDISDKTFLKIGFCTFLEGWLVFFATIFLQRYKYGIILLNPYVIPLFTTFTWKIFDKLMYKLF